MQAMKEQIRVHSHLANCVCDEKCRERLALTSLKTVPTSKMLQLTLNIGKLLKNFKQSVNKASQICQSKSYIIHPNSLRRCIDCSNILEIVE